MPAIGVSFRERVEDMIPEKIESVTLNLGDGVSMQLNLIPAGRFVIGSP